MIRIGDFSKLSRVTVKTLRYYDETGLLKPVRVDPFTEPISLLSKCDHLLLGRPFPAVPTSRGTRNARILQVESGEYIVK
jgi:hypothetical protein